MNSFFTTNVWLKIASLMLAIALWFFVILSGRSETTMDVPVTFVNLPAGLEIVESPQTVSVILEGQERSLRSLRQNELSVAVDLAEAKGGKSFFTLTKDNFNIPKMLAINGIDPETISLKIEAQLQKTVAVKPSVVGLPQKGFAILEIRVVPDKVELEGPQSAVTKIRSIKTEPIDINGINADLVFKANLDLDDSTIKKSTNKVEVNITVKKIE